MMGGETSESDYSDNENNSDGQGKKAQKRKKSRTTISKHRAQKYRSQWEKLPLFRRWICPDEKNPFKAKCRFCFIAIKAELTVIKKHAESTKHTERCNDIRPEVQKTVEAITVPVNNKVQRAEIQLCAFFVSHNISFSVMDHLCEVLKNCFNDSKTAQSLKLRRTNATAVVKHVIGETQKDRLIEKLKNSKFSILTDESTDIGTVKTTCIVVRFYDEEIGKIMSQFWDLVQVFGPDPQTSADSNFSATAEHLFSIIIDSFDKHNIPRENIIGFGSDGCNTMMGSKNSVATRFRDACPGIIVMKCVCHSLHLCASEACKKLPRICEDFARHIYNYFKSICKRQCKLVQFQVFLNLDVHKILHPLQTRWLSLSAVVDRIVEQWDALRLFFDYEYLNERLMAVEEVHRQLNSPFMKAYYFFLQWALPKFTNLNKYFQSESVVIASMHTRMIMSYKDLLGSFMKREYLVKTPVHDVNPEAAEEFVPLPNLYLGVAVMRQLEETEVQRYPHLIEDFKKRCREFLSTGCVELKKRYDFNDNVLSSIAILTPGRVLSSAEREVMPSIIPLTKQLPRVSPTNTLKLQALDDEWRQMPLISFPDEIKNCFEIDAFWHKVSKYKDSEGEPYLKILPSFALAALSIPHSNAQCKRVFSKVNLVKTVTRNRLVTPTITGCLLSSECVKGTQQCCQSFEPTKDMFSRMTAANLYSGDKTDKTETALTDDDAFTFRS